jgi:hypothetical protein
MHPGRLIMLIMLVMLSACAQPLRVTATTGTVSVAVPPQPRPVEIQPVNIQVVTLSNLAELQAQFRADPQAVILTMGVSDYEALVNNVGDIRRYIQQQSALISYYQTTVTSLSRPPTAPGATTP